MGRVVLKSHFLLFTPKKRNIARIIYYVSRYHNLRNGKPVEKQGRKAAGLKEAMAAGLPKKL